MSLRLIRYLFITESIINTISIVVFLLKPELMLQGLIADTSQITPLSLEMLRWYGGVLLMITIMLWRALFSKNPEFLGLVLEAHMIGDIVYLISQVLLANLAGWVFGTYFSMAFISILFIARGIYLLKTRTRLAAT
jgi:hypothetical protein